MNQKIKQARMMLIISIVTGIVLMAVIKMKIEWLSLLLLLFYVGTGISGFWTMGKEGVIPRVLSLFYLPTALIAGSFLFFPHIHCLWRAHKMNKVDDSHGNDSYDDNDNHDDTLHLNSDGTVVGSENGDHLHIREDGTIVGGVLTMDNLPKSMQKQIQNLLDEQQPTEENQQIEKNEKTEQSHKTEERQQTEDSKKSPYSWEKFSVVEREKPKEPDPYQLVKYAICRYFQDNVSVNIARAYKSKVSSDINNLIKTTNANLPPVNTQFLTKNGSDLIIVQMPPKTDTTQFIILISDGKKVLNFIIESTNFLSDGQELYAIIGIFCEKTEIVRCNYGWTNKNSLDAVIDIALDIHGNSNVYSPSSVVKIPL